MYGSDVCLTCDETDLARQAHQRDMASAGAIACRNRVERNLLENDCHTVLYGNHSAAGRAGSVPIRYGFGVRPVEKDILRIFTPLKFDQIFLICAAFSIRYPSDRSMMSRMGSVNASSVNRTERGNDRTPLTVATSETRVLHEHKLQSKTTAPRVHAKRHERQHLVYATLPLPAGSSHPPLSPWLNQNVQGSDSAAPCRD
jgi:hypothetical protein